MGSISRMSEQRRVKGSGQKGANPTPAGLREERLAIARFLPTSDHSWLLVEEGFSPAREHEIESLFAIGNGYLGTRASIAEDGIASSPATFIAGVFDSGGGGAQIPELVMAPDWVRLRVLVEGSELRLGVGRTLEFRRVLDMRRGMLLREWRQRDDWGRITHIRTLRLASLANRHALVEMMALCAENYSGRITVESMVEGRAKNASGVVELLPLPRTAGAWPTLVAQTVHSGIVLAFALRSRLRGREGLGAKRKMEGGIGWIGDRWEWSAEIGDWNLLEKLVAVYTSRDTGRPMEEALERATQLTADGLDSLLATHERTWAMRWAASDVEIVGHAEAQRALRVAGYHLISVVNPDDDRVSVGARGLTGEAYKGHVFWDTDIFLLPFYVFTYPAAARSLLRYRYRTLPAAREKARRMGYRGALYAWESADTGEETTPQAVIDPDGNVVPILSGQREHHISADVAYAVWQYWEATKDDDFLLEGGAEILLETARFWASRAALGEDGRYHISQVIGPDEYHTTVDDNAYTNVMAQWNLERGVEIVSLLRERWPERWADLMERLQMEAREPAQWQAVAEGMYTGFDPATGLYEQFKGYFALDDIDLAAYTPRTVPMDVLLGRARTEHTKVLKQADVVMLICLLWDRFPPEVREANFRYYEPRTDHGSSLSPSIYALVAARLNDMPLAGRYLGQAAEVDLADNMGNGALGVHLGALGGLWQATVFGCAGARMWKDGLIFDPHLLPAWQSLRFAMQWQGRRLRIAISGRPALIEVMLEDGEPMVVAVEEGPEQRVEQGKVYRARRTADKWSGWQEGLL